MATTTTTTRESLTNMILRDLRAIRGSSDPFAPLNRAASSRLGCGLSRARKSALEALAAETAAELAAIEADESANSDEVWLVVRLDGVTNSKIVAGPFRSVRAARAAHHFGRHWMAASAETLNWQGPVQR